MHWKFILLILMGWCSLFKCRHYEYYFIEEYKTWHEAQAYCKENYKDLATVPNMKYMERLYTDSPQRQNQSWIGLYSISGKEKRMWHWSLPGVAFNANETSWSRTEPNDGDKHLENCVRLDISDGWKDVGCNNNYTFICYNEQNKTFNLSDKQQMWREAQSYCREHHTDLASGLTQLKEAVNKFQNTTESLWIGLFRDTWRWSDGSDYSYRHWKSVYELSEEQNITENNTMKCVMTESSKPGKWSSDNCTMKKPFFCYDDKLILVKEEKTWAEALNYCREHYHDLVSITNLKLDLVQATAKKASTSHVWLGLRYSCVLDLWFWVNDHPLCNEIWPIEGDTEMCDLSVAMQKGEQYKWFKKSDQEKFNFICSL